MKWNVREQLANDWACECNLAVELDEAFDRFRALPIVQSITENKQNCQTLSAWNLLIKGLPEINSLLPIISEADKIGGPPPISKTIINGYEITHTTVFSLFYLFVVENLLGKVKGKVVAEIGGGYGNFANILFSVGGIKRYIGYDLFDTIRLQKKFLEANKRENIFFPTLSNHEEEYFDLIYSCCSLSELTKETQESYLPILRKGKRGFHIWNWGFDNNGENQTNDRVLKTLEWFKQNVNSNSKVSMDNQDYLGLAIFYW